MPEDTIVAPRPPVKVIANHCQKGYLAFAFGPPNLIFPFFENVIIIQSTNTTKNIN